MFIPLHDANALTHVRLHYVTLGLIALNVAIWLTVGTSTFVGEEVVRQSVLSFGFIPAVVNDVHPLPEPLAVLPEDASYVTYAFLHGDFMHLAGNMLFLWVFGDNVEDATGHIRFLFFYLACAAAGAWLHAFVDPQSVSPLIGASAAASGVVAAYVLLHPNVRLWVLAVGTIPLRIRAYWAIGAWIAFQFFNFLFLTGSQVSWAAHVGGIVTGAVMIVLLRRRGVSLLDREIDAKPAAGPWTQVRKKQDKNTSGPWGRGG